MKFAFGVLLFALCGTVAVQQIEISSLQSLVLTQTSAIKDLAEDSVKNSDSISELAQASINHSEALKSVNDSVRMLAHLR